MARLKAVGYWWDPDTTIAIGSNEKLVGMADNSNGLIQCKTLTLSQDDPTIQIAGLTKVSGTSELAADVQQVAPYEFGGTFGADVGMDAMPGLVGVAMTYCASSQQPKLGVRIYSVDPGGITEVLNEDYNWFNDYIPAVGFTALVPNNSPFFDCWTAFAPDGTLWIAFCPNQNINRASGSPNSFRSAFLVYKVPPGGSVELVKVIPESALSGHPGGLGVGNFSTNCKIPSGITSPGGKVYIPFWCQGNASFGANFFYNMGMLIVEDGGSYTVDSKEQGTTGTSSGLGFSWSVPTQTYYGYGGNDAVHHFSLESDLSDFDWAGVVDNVMVEVDEGDEFITPIVDTRTIDPDTFGMTEVSNVYGGNVISYAMSITGMNQSDLEDYLLSTLGETNWGDTPYANMTEYLVALLGPGPYPISSKVYVSIFKAPHSPEADGIVNRRIQVDVNFVTTLLSYTRGGSTFVLPTPVAGITFPGDFQFSTTENNGVVMFDIVGKMPKLRRRQRDDEERVPYIRSQNQPSSRQASIRQGNANTYL